jgi:hypothetical protein
MQLRAFAVIAALAVASALASPAAAAVCVLVPGTAGQLGDPVDNHTRMSSEDGGHQTSFTALISLGSSTITVGAPSVIYTGPSPHPGDTPAIRYSASGLLGSVKQQAYTGAQTSFGINTLDGTVTAIVNGQITNAAGFTQGDYTLRTVVTCS